MGDVSDSKCDSSTIAIMLQKVSLQVVGDFNSRTMSPLHIFIFQVYPAPMVLTIPFNSLYAEILRFTDPVKHAFLLKQIAEILSFRHKCCDLINSFLNLSLQPAIILYNAVERCNMLADCVEPSKALPTAELLFVIPEGIYMAVSYKKLWKLLIDKDIKKKDLSARSGVSPATITKMGKNGHVTTEVLLKICTALECGIDDIMEIIPENTQ